MGVKAESAWRKPHNHAEHLPRPRLLYWFPVSNHLPYRALGTQIRAVFAAACDCELRARIQSRPLMSPYRHLRLTAVAGLMLALGGVPSPAQTIPEYEQQADQLRRDHQVEAAIELLQAGLERHPGEPRLLLPLSLLLVESGKAEEAEQHLQRVLSLQPLDPEAHRSLGEAYLQQGRLPRAIRHFQQSSRLSDSDGRVHFRLGVCAAG